MNLREEEREIERGDEEVIRWDELHNRRDNVLVELEYIVENTDAPIKALLKVLYEIQKAVDEDIDFLEQELFQSEADL